MINTIYLWFKYSGKKLQYNNSPALMIIVKYLPLIPSLSRSSMIGSGLNLIHNNIIKYW